MSILLRKKSHRNNKQLYYSLNFLKLLIPNFFYRNKLKENLNEIKKYDVDYIKMRVNYYNKMDRDINLPDNISNLSSTTPEFISSPIVAPPNICAVVGIPKKVSI